MLVQKKEANRQSMILLQSSGPSAQLLAALQEVGRLTQLLEEARQERQQQVRTHPHREGVTWGWGAGLGHGTAPGLVVVSPGWGNWLQSGSDPSIAPSVPIPRRVPQPGEVVLPWISTSAFWVPGKGSHNWATLRWELPHWASTPQPAGLPSPRQELP